MHLRAFPTAVARSFLVGACVTLLLVASPDAFGQSTNTVAVVPLAPVVPIPAGDAATSTAPDILVISPVPEVTVSSATTVATAPPKRVVLLRGHGFGHGRGLGQWGAYGYAKDLGWNYRRILDHYYGGTVAGQVSPRSAIGVRLTALDSKPLIVFQPKGRLYTAPEGQPGFTLPPGLAGAQSPIVSGGSEPVPAGTPVVGPVVAAGAAVVGAPVDLVPVEPPLLSAGPAAVRVQLVKGGFEISDGPTCVGPWSVRPGLLASPSVTVTAGPADPIAGPDDADAMLQVCVGKQRRVYRGDLLAVDGKPGQKTVNLVGLDAYIRGVVPREIAAAWGDKAPEAVKAQAVAARSYAAAEKRSGYANTCDTIACQVYNGRGIYDGTKFTSYEDPRTDRAVAATANEVRVNVKTGTPVRTEFSASTGGHTAPGDFPPVPDDGDATDGNPNHDWTVRLGAQRFESSTKLGTLLNISVTKRDGFGVGGGRAAEVTLTYASGVKTRTGVELMSSFGLRSSWFDAVMVADGTETQDTVVDAAAALTGDSGTIVAAAAITPATKAKQASSASGAKAKKVRSVPTTTAVIVVAAGAAPVNTVVGGEIAGAPTTVTTKAATPPRGTKRKRTTKKR